VEFAMIRSPLAVCAGFAMTFVLLCVPLSAHADARADLHAAYAKMLSSRFATTTVATGEDGKAMHSSAEFETSERIRVTTDTGGFIILPEGTWVRSGADGAWSKPPMDLGGMIKQMLPQSLDDIRDSAKNVRDDGVRQVDGAPLRAIRYDLDTKVMGIAVSAQTVAYLDAGGRLVRSESDGVAMGRKTRSVQTIRYDDGIRVTPPG
jgi:hypothetical protein